MSAEALGDREFLEAFENGTLSETSFHHREHVRLAWIYLRNLPPAQALTRFSEGLRRFAASLGKSGLYHETITWAYLLLIRERMARRRTGQSWAEFAANNPDVLTWKPSILDAYYREETLRSDLARQVFVLPDRLALRQAAEPALPERAAPSSIPRKQVD
jgi:hypothetical protein